MRYVVLGAGAVGSTVGGRLAEQGADVLLLARGAHARAVSEHGLRVRLPGRELHVRPGIAVDAGALDLRHDDVLLLATKSQDTVGLLDAVAGLPVAGAPDGTVAADALPVVCLQNGVRNERAALRRWATVYGACVILPSAIEAPGVVVAPGAPLTAMFEIGPYPAGPVDDDPVLRRICADFTAAGLGGSARAGVMPWKYAKLLRNLVNSLDAVAQPGDEPESRAAFRELVGLLRAEAEQVLDAAGIPWVPDAEWDAHRGGQVEVDPSAGSTGGSSSRQSLARGTGTIEADYLNGEIVLEARLHGLAAPVNHLVRTLATAASRAGTGPGRMDPRELLHRARTAH
ncbi:ketopantoate reductase family protein [Nakamurella endophytica]|uniref:2-dehydropantoate 2-reductase n=1 Tax=Nakamurella endophytica TaxID=1748367 RepID=A0A917T0C8_9ACTN|nr:2-dehydropantoate 2-reductase N-terminal domain-containing protein [Nakamurella endophytica]GGM04836.1 2-dehydropantoate 2-reductase [Nakamurella endophytica]